MHLSNSWRRLVVVMGFVALVGGGCAKTETGIKPNPDKQADTDQDGLADALEEEIGTDPRDPDTDGDGFLDADEYAVQLDEDPYTDNPLVADTAKVLVSISKSPQISVDYVTSSGKTVGESIAEGKAITKGKHSSWSIGASAGYSTLQGFNAEINGNHTWGKSSELQRNMQNVKEKSESSEISKSSGRLDVAVRVENVGGIMATLESIKLSASLTDPRRPGWEMLIGAMNYDSPWGSLDAIDLKPNEAKDNLPFVAKEIPLEKVEKIIDSLASGGQVRVDVIDCRLIDPKDEAQRSLDRFSDEIDKRTAALSIDYGPDVQDRERAGKYEFTERAPTEAYRVATYNPEGTTLSVAEALRRLQIPFETGTAKWSQGSFGRTKLGLLRVRDCRTDAKVGGYWVVAHTRKTAGGEFETQTFNPLKESVDLDKLMLAPRHSVLLAYISDADRDRVGDREELDWGTNPLVEDSDQDGLADGDEIEGWKITVGQERVQVYSHPLQSDTDGDGVSDKDEKLAGTHPAKAKRVTVVDDWNIAFARQLGTNDEDKARAIVIDSEANIYVAGETWGRSFDGNSFGPYMIARYVLAGERQWVEQHQNATNMAGTTYVAGMAFDGEGNLFTADSEYVKNSSHKVTRRNYVVVNKFNPDGKRLWKRELDSKSSDLAHGVAADAAGNVYVVGYTQGTLGDRGGAGKHLGQEAYLAKFTGDGKKVWVKQEQAEFMGPVTTDHEGNILAICRSSRSMDGQDHVQDGVRRQLVLIKYDSEGNQVWLRQFGFDKGASINRLTCDDSGAIYLAGSTASRIVAVNRGEADALLMKYDADGKRLWVQQLGTAGRDDMTGVFVRGETIYTSGTTRGEFVSDSRNQSEHVNIFLATYDLDGKRQSVKRLPTTSHNTVAGNVADDQGNIYIFGTTSGSFNEAEYKNRGKSDLLLLKLTPVVSQRPVLISG